MTETQAAELIVQLVELTRVIKGCGCAILFVAAVVFFHGLIS